MTKTDALELALQALEDETSERYCPAITSIKKALAEPEWAELTRGEILSWELPDAPSFVELVWFVERKIREKNDSSLRRSWTGLTNEELTDLFYNENLGQMSAVGQAIELLRERNT
jgi:hypothetical protein